MSLRFKKSGGAAQSDEDISLAPRAKKARAQAEGSGGAAMATLKSLAAGRAGGPAAATAARGVERNRGLADRLARDVKQEQRGQQGSSSGLAQDDRVTAALTAKAKLYDQLKEGGVGGGGGGSGGALPLLIDFEERRKLDAKVEAMQTQTRAMPDCERAVDSHQELVEIEDEFGRLRMVTKDSKLYLEHALRLSSSGQIHNNSSNNNNSNISSSGAWAWSRGHRGEEDYTAAACEGRAFGQLVQERIDAELLALQGHAGKDRSMQAPWERVLQSSARAHLEDVHAETVRAREGKGEASLAAIEGHGLVFPEGHNHQQPCE